MCLAQLLYRPGGGETSQFLPKLRDSLRSSFKDSVILSTSRDSFNSTHSGHNLRSSFRGSFLNSAISADNSFSSSSTRGNLLKMSMAPSAQDVDESESSADSTVVAESDIATNLLEDMDKKDQKNKMVFGKTVKVKPSRQVALQMALLQVNSALCAADVNEPKSRSYRYHHQSHEESILRSLLFDPRAGATAAAFAEAAAATMTAATAAGETNVATADVAVNSSGSTSGKQWPTVHSNLFSGCGRWGLDPGGYSVHVHSNSPTTSVFVSVSAKIAKNELPLGPEFVFVLRLVT